MSDRIAVMNLGKVEQIGSPREIYDRPATVFVAGFIGQANLWPAKVVARNGSTTTIEVAGRTLDVSDDESGLAVGEGGTFMVRPERMHVEWELSDRDRWTVDATVVEAVFQGPVVRYELDLPDGAHAVAHVPARRDGLPMPGDTVRASWSDGAGVLLAGSPEQAPKPADADVA